MRRQMTSNSTQRGGAALEAMLLIPIIALILTLMVNMGYNGVRHRKAQAAMRLGAFQFVDNLARTDKNKALQQAQGSVAGKMFPGEDDEPVKLATSNANNFTPQGMPDMAGMLSNVSFRHTVTVEVTRSPPYDIMPATPIKGSLVLAANTFTYCEFKDGDYDSVQSAALDGFSLVGGAALWLFGGCGTAGEGFLGIGLCKDRCDP